MRISLIADTMLAGGAEWFLLRFYTALKHQGHEVDLVVLRPDKIDRRLMKQFPDVVLKHAPVFVTRLSVLADRVMNRFLKKRFFFQYQAVSWLRKRFKEFKPDVIHSHLFAADVVAVAANKDRLQHVITIHGDYIEFLKKGREDLLAAMAAILDSVNAIVVITDEQRNILSQAFPQVTGKIHKIYNGYTSEVKANLPERHEGPFTFGMIARGIPEKGWVYALNAFRGLREQEARLIFFGEGAHIEELKADCNDPRVVFAGFTNEPVKAVEKMDVGLFPSYYASESLPTTIIEYLTLHKPVLTTDVGECRAMISEGNDMAGMIIPMVNGLPDTGALTSQMRQIIEDKVLYLKMAEVGAVAKRKFNMEHCIHNYLKVYSS